MTIEYSARGNTYYRGVLLPNLQTFIFNEKSFEEISAPTLRSKPVTEPLDFKNKDHQQKFRLVDAEARLQNNNLAGAKSGQITTNPDNSAMLNLTYSGNLPGQEFSVIAILTTDPLVLIQSI